MLSHEWRELEHICDRISTLRHRYENARKSQNTGLLEGLKADLATATRQRELLVQHISARLGTHAAGETAADGSGDAEADAQP